MQQTEILKTLMGENGYVSGQDMCSTLGVSRTSVWKAIENLREMGFDIESRTNMGYRLKTMPDLLLPETICPHIRAKRLGKKIICLETVDSTNNYLKTLAADGAEEGTVVIADHQSTGRGRMGRSFLSPPGKGVYLSVLLRPDYSPKEIVSLTSMAAVAICEAIETVSDVETGIKWVNDIIAGEKKVAGILTEMSIVGESGQIEYAIIGVGVNVHEKRDDFPDEVLYKATSLSMLGAENVARFHLAAEMINSLDCMYESLLSSKTNPETNYDFWEKYRSRSTTIGRNVKIIRGERELDALAEDIDTDGGLIVRYPDGNRETLGFGEISVRGKYGYV